MYHLNVAYFILIKQGTCIIILTDYPMLRFFLDIHRFRTNDPLKNPKELFLDFSE